VAPLFDLAVTLISLVFLAILGTIAGVAAALPEDFDHQVGEAVDHLGLVAEALGGVDHPQHLDDALDLVEASQKAPGRAQEIDPDLSRDLVRFLDRQVAPDLAASRRHAVHAAGAVPR